MSWTKYIVFCSAGNDSIAMIEHLRQNNEDSVTVIYNNTGWAHPDWQVRVDRVQKWCQGIGYQFRVTESEGLLALARRKKAWPRQGLQFCTEHLKRLPSIALMDALDPDAESVVCVGVRREESANRAQFPEWVDDSEAHGGRDCWAPLVRHTEAMRDELLAAAGFEPLPHRSQECYPCVNSNRGDLRLVSEDRIRVIEIAEAEMGVGKKSGKPKTFFRPYRHQGAVGIRNVIQWANDGHYNAGQSALDFGSGCDGGFCE